MKEIILLLLVFLPQSLQEASSSFLAQEIDQSPMTYHKKETMIGILSDTTYCLVADDTVLGSIHCAKLPLVSCYIIHSFYIKPLFRRRGYGTRLLMHVLDTLPKESTIYIQPGPFEHDTQGNIKQVIGEENQENLNRLISFYQRFGFKKISSPFLIAALRALYYILSIPEDPHFLLVQYKTY